jgi:hypothetical protein
MAMGIVNQDGERFQESYMDNIAVDKRDDEVASLSRAALTAYIGRSTNIGAIARLDSSERLDREAFAGVQSAGRIGSGVWLAQLEYGSVRERLSPDRFWRSEGYAAVLFPDIPIGESTFLRFRTDGTALMGGGTDFAWVRTQASFHTRFSDQADFALAYVHGFEAGTPLFTNDRLYSKRAIHGRVDLKFAATSISFLAKYDFDRDSIYDYEITVGQLMHCLRPYVTFRSFPNSFAFGIEIEAQRLFEELSKRRGR